MGKHSVSVPEYVRELVDEAQRISGGRLYAEEYKALPFDCELKMAVPGRSRHTLLYASSHREHLAHFFVNSAYKILRLWEAPENERYVPVPTGRQKLPQVLHNELAKKLLKLGLPQETMRLSHTLFAGLARQITSMPLDIRVEGEIALALPEHSERQMAYLELQVHNYLRAVEQDYGAVVPAHVADANIAMNLAFAEKAMELGERPLDAAFEKHKCWPITQWLIDIYLSIDELGRKGDRLLVDAWAEELGLRDWYEWKPWSKF